MPNINGSRMRRTRSPAKLPVRGRRRAKYRAAPEIMNSSGIRHWLTKRIGHSIGSLMTLFLMCHSHSTKNMPVWKKISSPKASTRSQSKS
jgi:hypothetical protein